MCRELGNSHSACLIQEQYSVRAGELFDYVVARKYLSELETRFVFWQLFSAIQVKKRRTVSSY